MVVIVAVFVNVSPQMGGKHSQEDKIRYQESGHYVDGKFMNLVETTMDFTFSSSIDLMKAYIKGNPKSKPDHDLPVLDADSTEIAENSAERLIWFGHLPSYFTWMERIFSLTQCLVNILTKSSRGNEEIHGKTSHRGRRVARN